MELIIAPPRIAIRFQVSLLHNLLTISGLLENADRYEGLSEWIRQEARPLSAQDRAIIQPVTMLLTFATGIQAYLSNSVPAGSAAESDFDTLYTHLSTLDSDALQNAAFHALRRQLIYLNVLPEDKDLNREPESLCELIEAARDVRKEYWQASPMEISTEDFIHMLLDANRLHQHILSAIAYIWHHIYQSQARDDLNRQIQSAKYYSQREYTGDFPTIFRTVTGRQVPENLRKNLNAIQNITLVPTSHIGVYVTISIFKDDLWVGFNANVAPATTREETSTPVAELYPAMRALADETRLKMIGILAKGEQNVGDIAELLHLTQSTASRHLSLLAKTDILHVRREGTMRYYILNPQRLSEIGKSLQHFAQ